jgi:hypothetical protein
MFLFYLLIVAVLGLGAWGLELEAWGFAPYYIINSGCP